MKVLILLLFALTTQKIIVQAKAPILYYEESGEIGEPTTLHCNSSAEQVHFEWSFGVDNVIISYTDDPIDHKDERVEFIGNLTKGNASITIKDLRLNDAGVYTCEWTYYSAGAFVDDHILVNLTITAPPPIHGTSGHIVAIIITLLLIVGCVVGGLLYCRHKKCGPWKRN